MRDRVFISTVHKAKGLEFDNVIITDVKNGTYPFFKSHSKAERVYLLSVGFMASVHRPCKSKERPNFPITHCRIYT